MHQRPSIVERLNVDLSQTEPFQRCVKDPKTPGAEGWNKWFLSSSFWFSWKFLLILRDLSRVWWLCDSLESPFVWVVRFVRFVRFVFGFFGRFWIASESESLQLAPVEAFGAALVSAMASRREPQGGHLGIWASGRQSFKIFQDLLKSISFINFYHISLYFYMHCYSMYVV